MASLKSHNWETIARGLHAAVRKVGANEVELATGRSSIRIASLNGELFISEIKPIDQTVVISDHDLTDETMAYRIGAALKREEIDYGKRLSPAVEEDEEEGDDDGEDV